MNTIKIRPLSRVLAHIKNIMPEEILSFSQLAQLELLGGPGAAEEEAAANDEFYPGYHFACDRVIAWLDEELGFPLYFDTQAEITLTEWQFQQEMDHLAEEGIEPIAGNYYEISRREIIKGLGLNGYPSKV